jgi:quinol monooxygenase YgiN
MFGLIGKMTAAEGRRSELAAILLDGLQDMPGCRSYVVAADPGAPDVLWITEVWDSRDAHAASLSLPSVQGAIERGRPLIASLEPVAQTEPLGGEGL